MSNCKDCGQLYEPTGNVGRCLPCRRKWEKAWCARRKAAGNPVLSTKMPREYHQRYERSYFEKVQNRERRNALMRGYAKAPSTAPHHAARQAVRNAILRGDMRKQHCEVCGTKAQAHHDDYSKPLDVRWLCAVHHREHHAKAEGRNA